MKDLNEFFHKRAFDLYHLKPALPENLHCFLYCPNGCVAAGKHINMQNVTDFNAFVKVLIINYCFIPRPAVKSQICIKIKPFLFLQLIAHELTLHEQVDIVY